MDFTVVSWVGAAVAGVAFFAFGGLWYGPLFGKQWMAASGVTEEAARASNLPAIFGATLVLEILAAVGLAAMIGLQRDNVAAGALTGLFVALVVVVPVLGVLALYERKPVTLWALNAGYNLVGFVIMGAVIGAFQG